MLARPISLGRPAANEAETNAGFESFLQVLPARWLTPPHPPHLILSYLVLSLLPRPVPTQLNPSQSAFFRLVRSISDALAYYGEPDKCAGAFYGGDGSAVAANVVFILAVVAWVCACCMTLFMAIKLTIGMRVDKEMEVSVSFVLFFFCWLLVCLFNPPSRGGRGAHGFIYWFPSVI